MRSKLASGLPWAATCLLYLAGIIMIFVRSADLTTDTARLLAMAIQAFLAGAIVHGATKMVAAVKQAGETAARIRLPLQPPKDK